MVLTVAVRAATPLAILLVCAHAAQGQDVDPGDILFTSFDIEDEPSDRGAGNQPRTGKSHKQDEAAVGDDPALAMGSPLGFMLGVNYSSAFFPRGFRAEDDGLIIQPYASLMYDLYNKDDVMVTAMVGVWNSFHDRATGSPTNDSLEDKWFESDIFAGIGVETGDWAFETRYIWMTSPSDAFSTMQELYFSAAYDDESILGDFSLQPTAVLAFDTGNNQMDGRQNGTYLQLGISPGFEQDSGALQGLEVNFPVTLGLSLSDYFQDASGQDDFFGFAAVGATASLPIGPSMGWGDWKLNAGVQAVFLGDTTSDANAGDDFETIATAGISVEF